MKESIKRIGSDKNNDFDKLSTYKRRKNDDFKVNTSRLLVILEERMVSLDSIIDEYGEIERPVEKLHITTRGRNKSYYIRADSSEKKGTYINKKEMRRVYALAQNTYDYTLCMNAKGERKILKRLYDHVSKYKDDKEKMDSKFRNLISPLYLEDKEYIEEWENVSYERKEIISDSEFYTIKGERVRSKSEVLIADALNRRGIAYHYEYPIVVNGRTIHPDFHCLKVSSRKEVIYEHFGMMDSPEYVTNVMLKINTYEAAGLKMGEDYIFTMESASMPLSTRAVERIIDRYLM